MKVIADYDLCEANGLCESFAPEMFELDDDDNLNILDEQVTDANKAYVQQAAAACPKAALSLDGRVAVVTGAGAGLGRAEALALARAGAHVVLNDLPGAGDDAVDEIRGFGAQASVGPGDGGERAAADALLAATADDLGRLDIVVNNAGVIRDRMLFNMSDEEWDLVLRVHLRGHFLLSRNAAAHWRSLSKQTGGPVYGRVVNTASEAFLVGSPGPPKPPAP